MNYLRILKDNTMDDKLIYIHNDDKQNHPFRKLNNWLKVLPLLVWIQLIKIQLKKLKIWTN